MAQLQMYNALKFLLSSQNPPLLLWNNYIVWSLTDKKKTIWQKKKNQSEAHTQKININFKNTNYYN